MKNNQRRLAGILCLASLIVAPAILLVNPSRHVYLADGSPLPPPIPHGPLAIRGSVLIADGSPLPPPIPHGPLTT